VDGMMLACTESKIYTQVAVFERNVRVVDRLGARTKSEWEESATAICRLWWWKASRSSDKSPSDQYARPQASIDVTGANVFVPLGTDVTDEDRLARVEENGEVVAAGPFRIFAVNRYVDHLELALERP
jgi:hypothetical protein